MSEEFYTNRELFEIIQTTVKEMADLKKEMAETRAIIRDYNSLRKRQTVTELKLNELAAKMSTLIWIVGVSIPALGLLFTFLNYLGR